LIPPFKSLILLSKSNMSNMSNMNNMNNINSNSRARRSVLLTLVVDDMEHDISNLSMKLADEHFYPLVFPKEEEDSADLWNNVKAHKAPLRRCHTAPPASNTNIQRRRANHHRHRESTSNNHPPNDSCLARRVRTTGDSPTTASNQSCRTRGRFITFQERQLERTLAKETRIARNEEDVVGPTTASNQSNARGRGRFISFQARLLERTLAKEARIARNEEEEDTSFTTSSSSLSSFGSASYSSLHSTPCMAHAPMIPLPTFGSEIDSVVQRISIDGTNSHHHTPSNHHDTTTTDTVMEIAPNLFLPYRGSQESWKAVNDGRFAVATCLGCTLPLVVLDSAEYLLCPECHTVSPLLSCDDNTTTTTTDDEKKSVSGGGGVGLGIKREWCETALALLQQGRRQQ